MAYRKFGLWNIRTHQGICDGEEGKYEVFFGNDKRVWESHGKYSSLSDANTYVETKVGRKISDSEWAPALN